MSTLALCGACSFGDHANHDGQHHGTEGVLGGHQCPCPGDCKRQPMPLLDAVPTPLVPAVREAVAAAVFENGLRSVRDASAYTSGADDDYLRDAANDIADAVLAVPAIATALGSQP